MASLPPSSPGRSTHSFWLEHAERGRIGLLLLEDLEDPTPLLDLRLPENLRGKGLGPLALRAAADHVFTHFPEVTRFEGQTREDNRAMRAVFERCGWTQEALYRESWPVEGREPVGSVAYAILRREWQARREEPKGSASLDAKIQRYYAGGTEAERLTTRSTGGAIEARRLRDVLSQLPAGSHVLDVGGGTGVHAAWLAERGHTVTLLDPVPEQVEIAARTGIFTARVGDARDLQEADGSYDTVLLFGPLYHLPRRSDRLRALMEARRVLRPGGLLLAAGISRLSSFMDSMLDSGGANVSDVDLRILRTGEWTNPGEGFPGGHFHTARELREELEAAGFTEPMVQGIEMPSIAWELYEADEELLDLSVRTLDRMALLDADGRRRALTADLSPHLLATATTGPVGEDHAPDEPLDRDFEGRAASEDDEDSSFRTASRARRDHRERDRA
ncbi:GNAT family N-acetyltransferase [Brachybacterium sp. Marseille-Q7125]|uniref:GNAT family N-acetyltransferase n=1 Tax=Brachybacterium sp. Marseille-Q7125 TaxID=2932815 RepID=UPI001FF42FF5